MPEKDSKLTNQIDKKVFIFIPTIVTKNVFYNKISSDVQMYNERLVGAFKISLLIKKLKYLPTKDVTGTTMKILGKVFLAIGFIATSSLAAFKILDIINKIDPDRVAKFFKINKPVKQNSPFSGKNQGNTFSGKKNNYSSGGGKQNNSGGTTKTGGGTTKTAPVPNNPSSGTTANNSSSGTSSKIYVTRSGKKMRRIPKGKPSTASYDFLSESDYSNIQKTEIEFSKEISAVIKSTPILVNSVDKILFDDPKKYINQIKDSVKSNRAVIVDKNPFVICMIEEFEEIESKIKESNFSYTVIDNINDLIISRIVIGNHAIDLSYSLSRLIDKPKDSKVDLSNLIKSLQGVKIAS